VKTADHAAAGAQPHLKRASVRIFPVFCMIYIFASAGAFTIEDMVSASGPGLTILLLVLLPIFWSLPMALIACELGSALPGEGGFYTWVRRGLGDFWGFQAGWWWALSVFVDSSVYVVLTASYLQSWFGFDTFTYYLVCWGLIAVFATMNVIGVSLVAASTTLFTMIIVAPFIALSVVGIAQWQHNPFSPMIVPGAPLMGADGVLVIGLAIGVWMYSGYESMSTLAGEIRNPQKIIPRALLLALPFIAVMYLLPTIASLAAYGQWESFGVDAGEGKANFVEIGRALGGPLLGMAMLASALVSNISAYLDYLAAGARPLFAFSEDGLFPTAISRVSRRFGTPIAAILLMAAINAVLVIGPFQNLLVIDVMLLISAYLLIFISAVRLRIKEPQLKRRFRVPLGTAGMTALIIPPILIVLFTIYINAVDRSTELFGTTGFSLAGMEIGWYGIAGFTALLSGPPVYAIFRRIYGGPRTPSHEAGNEAIAMAEAEARAETGLRSRSQTN
jgi:amino acid transporter